MFPLEFRAEVNREETKGKDGKKSSSGMQQEQQHACWCHINNISVSSLYRAMLRTARLCDSNSSVRPFVCDVKVWFSDRLEYFENNFTANC